MGRRQEDGGSLVPYTVLRMELADLRSSTSGMVPVGWLHPSSSPRREREPQRACHSVPWGKPPKPQRGPTRPDRPATETQRESLPGPGGARAVALLRGMTHHSWGWHLTAIYCLLNPHVPSIWEQHKLTGGGFIEALGSVFPRANGSPARANQSDFHDSCFAKTSDHFH